MRVLQNYEIFLDDERAPGSEMYGCVIVRSFEDFKTAILERGVPRYISFDHDLGPSQDTGMTCAKFLVDNILDDPPEDFSDFQFYVHSQNPAGASNIRGLLEPFVESFYK